MISFIMCAKDTEMLSLIYTSVHASGQSDNEHEHCFRDTNDDGCGLMEEDTSNWRVEVFFF